MNSNLDRLFADLRELTALEPDLVCVGLSAARSMGLKQGAGVYRLQDGQWVRVARDLLELHGVKR